MPPSARQGGTTRSEVVRWPLGCWLLPALPLVVLLASTLAPIQRQRLPLLPGESQTSRPFRLKSGWIGSPAIDLSTTIPADSSMVLEVELLDAGGRVVLALSKEGWRETGVWREDGESGTYDESDTAVPLRLRPPRSGSYRLRLSLEELLDKAGQPLSTPLTVQARVRNHSVDAPLLLFTSLVSALMVAVHRRAVYGHCRSRVIRRVDDDEASVRCPAGGEGLLRVRLRARYEPVSDPVAEPVAESGAEPVAEPGAALASVPMARFGLRISDGMGRGRVELTRGLPLRRHKDEDDIWWTVDETLRFRLSQPDSYRFGVSLSDRIAGGGIALEWLELSLEDGIVEPWPAPVLEPRPLPGSA